MNRRDILKFFGAGSLVVPIVGGLPNSDAIARLIEPPNLELVESKIVSATQADLSAMTNGKLRVTVDITQVVPTDTELPAFGILSHQFRRGTKYLSLQV